MVLRKEHFSAYRINWKDKPVNILELSQELNIGLDSMVFLDDNPAEREFVNCTIPEVSVPVLPDKPYQLKSFFKELYEQYFQIYMLTEDDQLKTRQYQSNKNRQIFKKNTTSMEEYLSGLRMELSFQYANDLNISRIAQMTQKTNQFNLTTRRYTEENIRSFLKKGHLIFCASLKDKFGDNGITAACIVELNIEESMARIDTFLVSCRILGRQVEKTFVSLILNELKKFHINKVEAFFIATGKNMQVSDFCENYGFKLQKETDKTKEYMIEIKQNFEIDKFLKIEMVK
jgi:FkbH-like protein